MPGVDFIRPKLIFEWTMVSGIWQVKLVAWNHFHMYKHILLPVELWLLKGRNYHVDMP